jgi:signal transduction histidine kinase
VSGKSSSDGATDRIADQSPSDGGVDSSTARVMRELALLGTVRLSMHELGTEIDQILQEFTYLPNVFICLIDEDPLRIRFVYCRDKYDRHVDRPIDGKGLTDQVYQTQKSLLLKRTDANQLLAAGELVNHGVPSLVWLGVPLWSSGRIIGVLATQDYNHTEKITTEEEARLNVVAPLIAGLVERTQSRMGHHDQVRDERERRRLKKALFGTIGHEVRSPLSVVQGYAELLSEALRGSPQERTTKRIAESVRELSEATDRMLDYSAAESGAIDSIPAVTDLDSWCISFQGWMQNAAHERGLELETTATSRYHVNVRLDAERLRQLLQHLARVAWRTDGVERLGFGMRVQPVFTVPNELLRLALILNARDDIPDTAIPGENLRNLGGISLADGRMVDGTSVSLAIADRFADMLGAEVKVSEGFGTPWCAKVVLTVPVVPTLNQIELNQEYTAASSVMRAKLQQLAQRTVVVDSDPTSRAKLVGFFEDAAGAPPIEVRGVSDIEPLMSALSIGVVILAAHAGADEIEAVRRVFRMRERGEVKPYLIAVSHDQSPSGVEQLLDGGADAYVPCPLNAPALLIVLSKAWLEHERRSESARD